MTTKKKSPLPPSSSSNPPLGSSHPPGKVKLDETLSTVASQRVLERGRRTLSDNIPKVTEEEIREFEEKLAAKAKEKSVGEVVDLKSRPSSAEAERVDLERDPEAARDLQEGVGVFRESVNTITSSLLLIIGKLEEQFDRNDQLAAKIASNNNVARLNSVLGIVLVVGVGYAVFQTKDIAKQNVATIREREKVTVQLVDIRDEMLKLKKEQVKTTGAVEKVEEEAKKKPTVELVADSQGGAKVVIRTPAQQDPKNGQKSKSLEDHPAPPPPTALEIPVKLPPGSKTTPALPHAPPPTQ